MTADTVASSIENAYKEMNQFRLLVTSQILNINSHKQILPFTKCTVTLLAS